MIYNKCLINILRQNSRTKISKLSRKLNIPLNTLYSQFEKLSSSLIKKNVTLLNYTKLGYERWIVVLNSSYPLEFNKHHESVNNIYRTNKGYLLDCVVKNNDSFKKFIFSLKEKKFEVSLHPVFATLKIEEAKV